MNCRNFDSSLKEIFPPMRIELKWCIILLLIFPSYGGCQEPISSLTDLREKYDASYQCVGDLGLATFSARVTSNQLTTVSKIVGIHEPTLSLVFEGADSFSLEVTFESGTKSDKTRVIKDLTDAIKNAVESFIYSYEAIAFSNPLNRGFASATIVASGSELIVSFPERNPNQVTTLVFDKDFKMTQMGAKDTVTGLSIVVQPTWVSLNGKLVLVSINTEFFQDSRKTFTQRMAIENGLFGRLYLPTNVSISAADPTTSNVGATTIEFSLDSYNLGLSTP
ncbi:hypothetical protein HYY75_03145 [bacterium]|nr:hypothetical protein [bacterium]